MDLRDARPHLNLYNAFWPLRTAYYNQPPAKTVFNEDFRRGQALHSVVSAGMHYFRRDGAQFGARAIRIRAFLQPGG